MDVNSPYFFNNIGTNFEIELLWEIKKLLNEVTDISNLKVSNNYKVIDRNYLNKVRALVLKVGLLVSHALSISENPYKRKALEEAKLSLDLYDIYLKKGQVNYFVLKYILSDISKIIGIATSSYGIKPESEEEYGPNSGFSGSVDIL